MNKQEFFEKLRQKLSKFPQKEIEDRISFYGEMIDDKMEEGYSEAEAVAEIGDIDKIVSQIVADISLQKNAQKDSTPRRRLKVWEIVLLVLGSPIWLSLFVSVAAIVVSAYVSLWAGIVSLWAVVGALCVCAVFGTIYGGIMIIWGDAVINLVFFGVGLACVGLAIFFYFGCVYATKGLVVLTKKFSLSVKNSFVKKGGGE